MAKLKFNSAGIAGARKYAITAKNTSDTVKDGIISIQNNMQSCVSGRNNISVRLANVRTSLFQIENDIKEIYQVVDNATTKYRNTEAQVVKFGQAVARSYNSSSKNSKNKGAFAPIISNKSRKISFLKNRYNPTSRFGLLYENSKKTPSKNERFKNQFEQKKNIGELKEKFDWKLDDLAFNIIENAGLVGATFSGIGATSFGIYKGFKDGNKSEIYKSLLGGGKNFVSTVGDLAENAYKVDPDWKEILIGNWKKGSAVAEVAEKTAKYADDNVFTGLLKSEGDGFLFSKTKNVGENMKVGAQWAGVAFSTIINGIDNYSDYEEGKVGAGRAIAETISETAVDIAIGAGATAAVGAAAVALGVSAPAVAVGAAATVAVWAVDTGVRLVTKSLADNGYIKEEKGLTELASDFILDIGEAYIENKVNNITKIGNAISAVSNVIGVKWGACFG